MPDPVLSFYQDRLTTLQTELDIVSRRNRNLSLLRLFIFLGGLILIGFATSWGWLAVSITSVLFLILFGFLVNWHLSSSSHKKHLQNLIDINLKEVAALGGDFSTYHDGSPFIDPDHPYTSDLDIFGPGSLFQFLNRTTTIVGRSMLAMWFKKPMTNPDRIRQEQEAIKELAGMPDLLQEIQAIGYETKEEPEYKQELLDWIKAPPVFQHWRFRFYTYLIPVIAAVVLYFILIGTLPVSFELLYLMIPFGILGRHIRLINQKHLQLSNKAEIIRKYSKLLHQFESASFTSERLKEVQAKLIQGGERPSESIHKLSKIMAAFDNRLNMAAGFVLNAFLLWDIRQMVRLEKWQQKHANHLSLWFETIAYFDAKVSLSIFHFNQPQQSFPLIHQGDFVLQATDAGHPIIPSAQRIDNPIDIDSLKQFLIITGANMAGKSTYLRTVGVNLILARMGAPVCASHFEFTPIELVSSIRTSDNLRRNESYFYAELKKLKSIIDRLEAGETLFILLDEILKGTNSGDKQSGSFALLKKLIRLKSAGLIATHDLALGRLEGEYPQNFKNACFEVALQDDQLIFDYLLKPGVAVQMNASFLMRKMGITD